MGLRGAAPTPTKILEARGSWRAKDRPEEPQLPVGAPEAPDWLSEEARAEWDRQVKHLLRMRVVSEADRALFASYCEAWSEFVRLTILMNKCAPGRGKNWRTLNCAKRAASDALLKLAMQFGFSPSARTRLKSVEDGVDDKSLRFFDGDALG